MQLSYFFLSSMISFIFKTQQKFLNNYIVCFQDCGYARDYEATPKIYVATP